MTEPEPVFEIDEDGVLTLKGIEQAIMPTKPLSGWKSSSEVARYQAVARAQHEADVLRSIAVRTEYVKAIEQSIEQETRAKVLAELKEKVSGSWGDFEASAPFIEDEAVSYAYHKGMEFYRERLLDKLAELEDKS